MDRIVADVYVPAINKTYDFILPCYMPIGQLTSLIGRTITEHENLPLDFEDLLLFSPESGETLDSSLMLAQTGVKDGSRLTVI